MPNDPHDPNDPSASAAPQRGTSDVREALSARRRFVLPPRAAERARAQLDAEAVSARVSPPAAERRRAAVQEPLVAHHPQGLCTPQGEGHFVDLLDLALALHR